MPEPWFCHARLVNDRGPGGGALWSLYRHPHYTRTGKGGRGPKTPLERRGSYCSAGCTYNQAGRPMLVPFRGANNFRPDCFQGTRPNVDRHTPTPVPEEGTGRSLFRLLIYGMPEYWMSRIHIYRLHFAVRLPQRLHHNGDGGPHMLAAQYCQTEVTKLR